MELHVGTSGFSYKEWVGNFYPEGISAKQYLSHYARQFAAVEINNTLYRTPKTAQIDSWAEQTPVGFHFAYKVPRRIGKELFRKEADVSSVDYLVEQLGAAASPEKTGCLYFQGGPYARSNIGALEAFTSACPYPTAFDFGHPSWRELDLQNAIASLGGTWCYSDSDDLPELDEGEVETITATLNRFDWGYLRLRRSHYDEVQLKKWRKLITQCGWQRAFVFFKHEDEGRGPKFAKSFLNVASR